MNWKQILINLLVMGVVYFVMYGVGYFFGKRWAGKKGNSKQDKK